MGHMTAGMACGLALLAIRSIYAGHACESCGKRLVHARDCWRRRD